MRSFASTARDAGPRGLIPPTRAVVAPRLSTEGGAYGSVSRRRGISSRGALGDGEAVAAGTTVGDTDGDGDGVTTDSHATRLATSRKPSRRIGSSVTTAIDLARTSSRLLRTSCYFMRANVRRLRLLAEIIVAVDPVKRATAHAAALENASRFRTGRGRLVRASQNSSLSPRTTRTPRFTRDSDG